MAESGEKEEPSSVLNVESDPLNDSASLDSDADPTSDDDFNYGATTTDTPEKTYFASSLHRWKPPVSEVNNYIKDITDQQCDADTLVDNSHNKVSLPRNLKGLGIILTSRRRNVQQTSRGAATAWIDRDDSGTYHPTADRATPPITPQRRVQRARSHGASDEDGSTSPRQRQSRRKVGWGLSITLRFTSSNALQYLRSITPGPQSEKPEGDGPCLDSDSGYRTLRRRKTKQLARFGETSSRNDGLTIHDLSNGHPQRRGCRGCFFSGDDECSLIEHADEYPCVACIDKGDDCELIIPPRLKNACERCKKKRIGCSYGKDHGEGVDSCKACEEAEAPCCAGRFQVTGASARYNDVGPHTPRRPRDTPNRQFIPCNECRVTGLRCNLKSKNQPGPCKYCIENEHDCTFTLIRDEFDAARIQVDRKVPTKKPGRGRLPVPKPWKRSVRHSTPPNFARDIGQEWLSQPEGRRKLKLSSLGKNEYCQPSKRSKSQLQVLASTSGANRPLRLLGVTNSIQHIIIRTPFSHPISFNHVPSPMYSTPPCTFCSIPLFGLFAHGIKTVEVVPWAKANGMGNEELDGGHANEHPNTKLCRGCTFARVRIIGCKKHIIQEIPKDDNHTKILEKLEVEESNKINFIDADEKKARALGISLLALDNGDLQVGALALATPWCSICPGPATHNCCTPQPFSPPKNIGCGLLLCAACASLYAKVEKGMVGEKGFVGPGGSTAGMKGGVSTLTGAHILDRTIKEAELDHWGYEMGIRADAEFLKLEGELMMRMNKGFGVGVEQRKKVVKGTVVGNAGVVKGQEMADGKDKKAAIPQQKATTDNKDSDKAKKKMNGGNPKPLEEYKKSPKAELSMSRPTYLSVSPTSSDFDSDSTTPEIPAKRRRITKPRAGSDEILDPVFRQVLMNNKVDGPFSSTKSAKGGKRGRGAGVRVGAGRGRGNRTRAGASGARGRGAGNGRATARGRGGAREKANGSSTPRSSSTTNRGNKAVGRAMSHTLTATKFSSDDDDEDENEDDDSDSVVDLDEESESLEDTSMEVF